MCYKNDFLFFIKLSVFVLFQEKEESIICSVRICNLHYPFFLLLCLVGSAVTRVSIGDEVAGRCSGN